MLLENIFTAVLRLSLYGTVGCIGVGLVLFIANYARAPKWISMILWGLLALRLVLPFSLFHATSTVSLFQYRNLSDKIETMLDFGRNYSGDFKTAAEGSALYDKALAAGIPASVSADGSRMAYFYERQNGRIEPAKTPYDTVIPIGARIWVAGMAALWLWAAVSYIRLRYHLRFAMRITNIPFHNIYETDAISSPCVAGLLRPRIYLIPGLTLKQQQHIILHEQMHIRHLDHLWKIVSFAVISIHWFNPALWLMYGIFQGELEKACDERVLSRLGADSKEDYGESLLAIAAPKEWNQKQSLPTPIHFGEDNIKGRIKRILSYKKPIAAATALVVILSAAGCGVFLTMPDSDGGNTTQAHNNSQDTASLTETPLDGQADTGGTSDSWQNPDAKNEPDRRTEYYQEIIADGIIYQAKWGGIYRRNEPEEDEELIYPIFAGTSPQMHVFEGKLYFMTDSSYVDGALDWVYNTIRWVDLQTLETGDLILTRENSSIDYFRIFDGILDIWYNYPSDVVETMMLYIDEEAAFNGKNITQLSDEEKQQYGQSVTQSVLQSPALVNISNRIKGQNISYLDMDGDGISEEIVLEPAKNPRYPENLEHDPLREFHLKVGNAEMDGYGDNLANILWAVSLDGQEILLVLYEDGPSADPYTHFYRYENAQIHEIGGFEDDIRMCQISPEGIITASIRKEIVQTDWIEMRWQVGDDGMLKDIPQDTYNFINGNWVSLLMDLPLHPEIGNNDIFTVKPQNVKFLQTSADWNWIFLETEDGRQGWVHLENYEVYELKKNVMDVFDGIYMAG